MRNKVITGLLTIGTLAGLGGYLWMRGTEVASITLVSPAAVALCACMTLACLLVVGPLFYVMINRLKPCVGLIECTWLSVVTTAVNLVVPLQGGAGVRAVYLKRRHDFAYGDFLATLYGYQVLRVLMCAVGGAVAIAWLMLGEGRDGLVPILAGVLVCLGLAAIACCLPRLPSSGRWFVDRLAAFTQGWHTLRSAPGFLVLIALLVALQLLMEVATFWAACAAIGVNLGLAEALAVGTLSTLVTVLGLTPSGLGLFEAMAAFVSSAVSLDPLHSVMAALVCRVVLIGLLAILTPLAYYELFQRTAGLGRLNGERSLL